MTTMTNDAPVLGVTPTGSRLTSGLLFALLSAASFGASGALGSGLLAAGWSPGAATLVRIALAALVVAPFGVRALAGRWWLLRRNAGLVLAYGAFAVVGAQFCYFSAIAHMPVGPAILIEFTAPAAVVMWMWLRHGQRPGPVTLLGAVLAGMGLVLVLDLLTGSPVSVAGVLWALGAMVGAAAYFVISADESNGLPPLTLAGGGLLAGAGALGLLALVGLLPVSATTEPVTYAGTEVPWWTPVLAIGLVTAALAYSAGIAASRRLGSRLASFVGLLEVVAAVLFAWLLLSEVPGWAQLLGGGLILTGVVAVKAGERTTARVEPTPA